jgi:hypothetical protein
MPKVLVHTTFILLIAGVNESMIWDVDHNIIKLATYRICLWTCCKFPVRNPDEQLDVKTVWTRSNWCCKIKHMLVKKDIKLRNCGQIKIVNLVLQLDIIHTLSNVCLYLISLFQSVTAYLHCIVSYLEKIYR